MDQDQIAVGMQVRYPRTGTTGAVVSLTTIRGDLYAEVETTNLLYRVDQLIAAEAKAQTGEEKKQDIRTILEKERGGPDPSGWFTDRDRQQLRRWWIELRMVGRQDGGRRIRLTRYGHDARRNFLI